jgi:hypothetical protein
MNTNPGNLPSLKDEERVHAWRHLRHLAGYRDKQPTGLGITAKRQATIEEAVERLVGEAAALHCHE